MKSKQRSGLRTLRVVVSLLFFAATSFLFIDPRNSIPQGLAGAYSSFQLLPGLLRLFLGVGLSSLGLILVLGSALAFGRVYCSSLCPLGTLQDIVIRLRRKRQPRGRRFAYEKPPFAFHYALLALIVALFALGSLTLLNLLEPFSSYGRMLTSFAGPAVASLNNLAASLLGGFQIYSVYVVPLKRPSISAIAAAGAFLALISYLSSRHGRIFCNALCPAGALLGLLSRFSIYKLAIDGGSCNACGACETVCKANCIDSESKRIDFSACIGCFNCVQSCSRKGIGYVRAGRNTKPEKPATPAAHRRGRRKFFRTMAMPSLGILLPALAPVKAAASLGGDPRSRRLPIPPAGAVSVARFTTLCTACHLCVSGCPAHVLYPSFIEYGAAGLFQPKLDFESGYCTYDCTRCSEMCPTGAIMPLSVDQKKTVQVGKATFVKEDCVVVSLKKDCAACSEHCPTKAVHMVPYEGALSIPALDNEICVGCGACEHACPTTPQRAIYITPNPVHLVAKKPPTKKLEDAFDRNTAFPF